MSLTLLGVNTRVLRCRVGTAQRPGPAHEPPVCRPYDFPIPAQDGAVGSRVEADGRCPFPGTIAAPELPLTDFRAEIIRLLESRIAAAAMSAAPLHIEQDGEVLLDWAGGRLDFDPSASPVVPESVFLITSITKPITCAAVAKLIEQGRIDLDDPVAAYLPEFGVNGKEAVRLRHCFTHTSGLPGRLPDDRQLRRDNAPLESFVASTCRTPPLRFPPGTAVENQSPGLVMLATVAERVTGERFRDFLVRSVLRSGKSWHVGSGRGPKDHDSASRLWRVLACPRIQAVKLVGGHV